MTTQRILVYGVTGSGKTTLAKAIAERTGLPWTEVDYLTWEPGWVQIADEEQRRRITEICSRDRWVLDTAYAGWRDVVLDRVELIVGLDYPRWRSLSRLVRRTFGRAIDHREICNGKRGDLAVGVLQGLDIAWHFSSFGRKRQRMRAWAADPAAPDTILLSSASRARAWLDSLPISR